MPRIYTKKSIQQRIDSFTIYEPMTGCIIFFGRTDKDGYGEVHEWHGERRVNRIVWIINKGPIPIGMNVLHHCDTPSCANIRHYFLGTHKDNMRDMVKKGRAKSFSRPGESNPRAKLTEEQVLLIRQDKRRVGVIAKEYEVVPSAISNIKSRKTWSYL